MTRVRFCFRAHSAQLLEAVQDRRAITCDPPWLLCDDQVWALVHTHVARTAPARVEVWTPEGRRLWTESGPGALTRAWARLQSGGP